ARRLQPPDGTAGARRSHGMGYAPCGPAVPALDAWREVPALPAHHQDGQGRAPRPQDGTGRVRVRGRPACAQLRIEGAMMRDVVIVEAVRTPIGRFRGGLSDIRADHLGAVVLNELLSRTGIEPRLIDDVVFG